MRLEGVEGELRDNVEAYLSLLQKAEDASATEVQRMHRGAKQEIEAALQPFGFYEPVVEGKLERRGNARASGEGPESWLARYRIDPGPQTTLRDVKIQLAGPGEKDPGLTSLITRAGLEPGTPLLHQRYEALKSTLLTEGYNQGYLDGRFERNQIRVHRGSQQADLDLEFTTGPRYQFGDVRVQQDILSDEFVERFVDINTGEDFSPRRLIDLQLALSDSGYFSSTEVQVLREEAVGNQVPVVINTVPARARRFEASLGYGTDTGARGRLGSLWRRLNENGHSLEADLRLSEIQQSLVGRYSIPIGDLRSETLDYTAELDQRNLNDVDSTRYALGANLNQNRWGGRRRLGLRYQYETWNFGDNPQEQSGLLIPSLEYDLVRADDVLFTRRGYSASFRLQGAAEGAASDATFVQAYVAARSVLPLGERGRLLLRGEYGATSSDDFSLLPPSLRFFNGGAQSVRGYGFEELSPTDPQGNLIGGEYMGTLSVEVDYLFYGNFGVAAFVDAGNASNDPGIDVKTGAGIGLRYRTPIGMVRIDFAHPFDDPDSSFAFHISLGPDLQ